MDPVLYILTGHIQCGKTRWLTARIDELEARGVSCDGVLAPGVWRTLSDDGGFEKLGIDNLLLPQREKVHFATRRDLLPDAGEGRMWVFHDSAIKQVDDHFTQLLARVQQPLDEGEQPHLLIVDELGWMELQQSTGLVHALELLDCGPTERYPHALIVVREDLLPLAQERFAEAWPTIRVIRPEAGCQLSL